MRFATTTARPLNVASKKMDVGLDRRPLVLVVDDDARSASLLARLLRTDGYETEVTIDGAAALARLTRDPVPQALVTGLELPHAGGLAISRYARSRSAEMPIFVLTTSPQERDAANAGTATGGPLHVLSKPLDYGALLRRLAGALGSAQVP